MDTAQWPQDMIVKPMEEIIIPNTNTNTSSKLPTGLVERKVRPQKDEALNCPRCNSTNTKFCYYNNYSLSQPRYFCKTCRRYWTEGGSLRNIPVGGGSRKNKKSSSNSNPSYSNNITVNNNNPLKKLPDLVPPTIPQIHQNPSKIHIEGSQDLNLGFSSDFKTINDLIQVPNYDGNSSNNNNDNNNSSSIVSSLVPPPPSSASSTSALELINGIASSRVLNNNSFMSLMPNISHDDPNSVYNSSGFSLMPSLNFSLDHHQSPYGNNNNHIQETNTRGRFLFPFVGLKQVSNTTNDEQDNRDHHQPAGESTYWNGMLGGGGSW